MKPTAHFIHWNEIEGFAEAKDKESFKAELNVEGCESFLRAHPEYPRLEAVAERIQEFLSRGDKPMVRANLELAYKALDIPRVTSVVELEPEPKKKIALNQVVAAQTADPTEEETEALEKLRDIPYLLSDAQRRVRDEKLRRAAVASRIAHRRHDRMALIG
jgi:hypothetical protein